MEMQANGELLNFVYQNAQMGVNTLEQLLDMVEDDGSFHAYLTEQLEGYQSFLQRAEHWMEHYGINEEGLSTFAQVRTYLMINLQTLTDSSVSHLAELLMVGSVMGMVQAIRSIRKYSGEADEACLALMQELNGFEEAHLERLKEFL